MYDESDHRPRDERDFPKRRSPSSRDHDYRSRHDSSRSPRRTPPRGPRGDPAYRRDGSPGSRHTYSDRDHERYDRGRGYYDSGAGYDDARQRRRDSPGYRRDARSPGRDRDRSYRRRDETRDRSGRSPRRGYSDPPSPGDPTDDGYYQDSAGYNSGPGRPYHTLKIDDIPEYMSPQEVDGALRNLGAADLVDVRIKSDDKGGPRRYYAFAEFRSDDASVDFLERNYPTIELATANGASARCYIAYSRERRHVTNPDDWKCTMCHFENFSRRATCKQCKAPRSTENVADMQLDGRSDECPQQTPSQFLVVRDLASSVNEHTLANGIKKLFVTKEDGPKQPSGTPAKLKSTAPVGNTNGLGAKPGSLLRVFVIREKYSEISCNYGFAEFANLDDARAAMAKFNASPQFTIASKPVTIAYIHSGVFIPYLHPVLEHEKLYTFSTTHNPTLRLTYWNPSVYASEFTIFNESLYEEKPQGTSNTTADQNQTPAKESKKRKAEKDLAAPGGKKAIAMAPQLAKWANKHAELHGDKAAGSNKETAEEDSTPATGVNALGPPSAPSAIPSKAPSKAPSTAPSTASVSYGDLDQMCCLLCRRKFINEPSLRRHEQISDMHKGNLEDEAKIAVAVKALKAVGKEPVSNYRDRAKERRIAHNQPSKPKAAHLPRKAATGNAPAAAEQPSKEATPAKPAVSKGAGLLAKMGWSTGDGLGAEGGGRKDIIDTFAYTPGVGLGAEGGKLGDAAEEAARNTKNDYADFVAKAKDKARERYQRMG